MIITELRRKECVDHKVYQKKLHTNIFKLHSCFNEKEMIVR